MRHSPAAYSKWAAASSARRPPARDAFGPPGRAPTNPQRAQERRFAGRPNSRTISGRGARAMTAPLTIDPERLVGPGRITVEGGCESFGKTEIRFLPQGESVLVELE